MAVKHPVPDSPRWLIAPVAEFLKGKTQVVINPDGALQTIPFRDARMIQRASPDVLGDHMVRKTGNRFSLLLRFGVRLN